MPRNTADDWLRTWKSSTTREANLLRTVLRPGGVEWPKVGEWPRVESSKPVYEKLCALFSLLGVNADLAGWRFLALWLLARQHEIPGFQMPGRRPAPTLTSATPDRCAETLSSLRRLIASGMTKRTAAAEVVRRANIAACHMDKLSPQEMPRRAATIAGVLKQNNRYPADPPLLTQATDAFAESDRWMRVLERSAPGGNEYLEQIAHQVRAFEDGRCSRETLQQGVQTAIDAHIVEAEFRAAQRDKL